MTDRKIMQQALDALNTCDWGFNGDKNAYKTYDTVIVNEAAKALRQALAQPEQEPVAKREWVGLTDEEMLEIWRQHGSYEMLFKKVEIKLKDKNTT